MADSKRFPLQVIIDAVDRFSGPFRRISSTLLGFHRTLGRIGDSFSKGLGIPQFTAGIQEARGHLDAFTGMVGRILKVGAAIGTLTAAVAFFGATQVNAFTESASLIHDTAQRLGITAEQYQRLAFGAKLAGIENEEFTKSLKQLQVNLGKTAIGAGGEAGKVLEALGFKLRDKVTGRVKDLSKAFPELADRLNKIKDQSKRAAAEAELFGAKLGPKMETLVSSGSKGIAALGDEAESLGGVLKNEVIDSAEDFGDKLDKIKAAAVGVRNVIVAAMLPSLHKLADQLIRSIKNHIPDIQKFAAEFGDRLPGRIEAAGVALRNIGTVLAGIASIFTFAADHADALGAALSALTAVYVVLAITRLTLAIKALGLAMTLTPIGLIITGIALLAAGAFLVIKNWDTLKAWWLALWPLLWQATKDFVSDLGTYLLQHNPIALLLRAGEALIQLLTGIDFGRLIGGKLPDWAQKLLGVNQQPVIGIRQLLPEYAGGEKALAQGSRFGASVVSTVAHSDVDQMGRDIANGPQIFKKSEVKLTVDLNNLPPGSNVKTDNPDNVLFRLNTGYNFSGE